MNNEGLKLSATAIIKLTKLDENGNTIEVVEQQVNLTREEAEALWHSQQQA